MFHCVSLPAEGVTIENNELISEFNNASVIKINIQRDNIKYSIDDRVKIAFDGSRESIRGRIRNSTRISVENNSYTMHEGARFVEKQYEDLSEGCVTGADPNVGNVLIPIGNDQPRKELKLENIEGYAILASPINDEWFTNKWKVGDINANFLKAFGQTDEIECYTRK